MNPQVDIVIPCWNRSDITLTCLQTLVDMTTNVAYRIILVDNGSTDQMSRMTRWFSMNTKRWVPWARYKGVRFSCVRLRSNLGFAKANNIGARKGNAPWMLFINNDAFPMAKGWLQKLLIQARACKWAAIGPTCDAVLGIQDRRWDARWPVAHEAKFLSGVSVLVNRKAFEAVGGWDEDYLNGDEDLDLSIRLRKAGYKIGVLRAVFVHHECSATMAAFVKQRGMTIREWFGYTRDLLLHKHGIAWHNDLFFWQQFREPRSKWHSIGVLPNGRYFQFPGTREDQSVSLARLRTRGIGAADPNGGQRRLYSRYATVCVERDTFSTRCDACAA